MPGALCNAHERVGRNDGAAGDGANLHGHIEYAQGMATVTVRTDVALCKAIGRELKSGQFRIAPIVAIDKFHEC